MLGRIKHFCILLSHQQVFLSVVLLKLGCEWKGEECKIPGTIKIPAELSQTRKESLL
jgi:hypothetical protein